MAISLLQLRMFVEVAQHGNIRDAAEKLGRTPSAVSMALKQLAVEVGGTLFESDRKSELTALGGFVLAIARGEVRSFERAVESIRAFVRNDVGRLDIACVPSVGAEILPGIVLQFLSRHPQVELDLRDTDTPSVIRAVEYLDVELGVGGAPLGPGPIDFEPLFRDAFVVCFSRRNQLAAAEGAASWEEIGAQAVIVNGASEQITDPAYRDLAAGAMLTIHNNIALLSMLRSNIGVTLLPFLAVAHAEPALAWRKLPAPQPFRTVGLLTRSGRALSPLGATFRAVLKADVARMITAGIVMAPA